MREETSKRVSVAVGLVSIELVAPVVLLELLAAPIVPEAVDDGFVVSVGLAALEYGEVGVVDVLGSATEGELVVSDGDKEGVDGV
jgi:hypothetical protein